MFEHISYDGSLAAGMEPGRDSPVPVSQPDFGIGNEQKSVADVCTIQLSSISVRGCHERWLTAEE